MTMLIAFTTILKGERTRLHYGRSISTTELRRTEDELRQRFSYWNRGLLRLPSVSKYSAGVRLLFCKRTMSTTNQAT